MQLHIRESILTMVVMDSGPTPYGVSRNDDGEEGAAVSSDLPDMSSPISPRNEKYFCFTEIKISCMFRSSRSTRGTLRGRHECRARDAMDAISAVDERG